MYFHKIWNHASRSNLSLEIMYRSLLRLGDNSEAAHQDSHPVQRLGHGIQSHYDDLLLICRDVKRNFEFDYPSQVKCALPLISPALRPFLGFVGLQVSL